jgi:UDP:flavonoid glycosyltransferase YjiC (YdhE family)
MAGRVVLTSVGSFGDLHPFIATGLELKARGVEAVIAASEDYRGKVEQAGLQFRAASPSVERLTAETGLDLGGMVRRVARSGTVFLVEKTIIPYAEQTFEELRAAMAGADLVVASSFAISARMAAETLGLPSVTLLLSPCMFLSAQDPPYLMEAPWLPGLRRRFGPRAAQAVLDLGRAQLAWRTRRLARLRRRLGLPPAGGDEALDLPLRADFVAALYSPALGPLPSDAPPNAEITGFSFYDSEGGEAPRLEPSLAAFLADGPAPLVFTLGSWSVHGAGDFYARAAATARRLERRAVLLVGREGEARLAGLASNQVFVAGYAPHSLVFPRAAAVIHHGGIGTVGQALRAGRPQLVCPVFGDQLDNAERLVRLGVARRLDHRRFEAARAAALLQDLLGDEAVSARAARLGAQVAAEDGAAVVADRIAAMLAARGWSGRGA